MNRDIDQKNKFALERRDVVTLAALIVVALLLRWGYVVSMYLLEGIGSFHFAVEIPRIAGSIANGLGFSGAINGAENAPTAWTTPLYPYFLSLIISVTGTAKWAAFSAALINGVISALTLIPIYLAAYKVHSQRAALVAAAIFTIEPTSIWLVRFAQDTTMVVALVACLFPLYVSLSSKPTPARFCWLGLFLGILSLVKSVALVLVVAVVGLTLIFRRDQVLSRRVINCGLLLICFCLVCAPWLYRNATVLGVYGYQSNFGLELKIGNNSRTYESLTTAREYPRPPAHPDSDATENEHYNELGEKAYMEEAMDAAQHYILSNPTNFVELTLIRVADYWTGYIGNFEQPFHRLKIVFFLTLLALSLLGAARSIKNPTVQLMLLCLLFIPAVYYVTHTISLDRYRAPILPALTLLAAFAFDRGITLFSNRSGVRPKGEA